MDCACGKKWIDCLRHLEAERERLRLRELDAKRAREDFELGLLVQKAAFDLSDEELVLGPPPEWMVA